MSTRQLLLWNLCQSLNHEFESTNVHVFKNFTKGAVADHIERVINQVCIMYPSHSPTVTFSSLNDEARQAFIQLAVRAAPAVDPSGPKAPSS